MRSMDDPPASSSMQGVNQYWRELSAEEIAGGGHRQARQFWDAIGRLQFEFVRDRGLKPAQRLLDVGCGPLRGGLHFIDYLDPGNYYGIDINRSRVEAGYLELRNAGLDGRDAHLAVIGDFDAGEFGVDFDSVIAISLFTHLFANHVVRCMKQSARLMKPSASFYATYFEAPESAYLFDLGHPGGIVSHFDADPFHYSFEEISQMAATAGLIARPIGFWGHPRGQAIVELVREDATPQ
jgi:cyclopropane fatty-acyl-phospholipid synthase-like methyltransferase